MRYIYNIVYNVADLKGYKEIETTLVELRERYLRCTEVNPTKIFEVRRVKEKSIYALQSDLAMGMSRFVSENPSLIPIKLIQNGNIYRDRPANIKGFRKEFKQTLIGMWGSSNEYYDYEVIKIAYDSLNKIRNIKVEYIQLSNFKMFEAIKFNLSKQLKFNEVKFNEVKELLTANDYEIMKCLYSKESMLFKDAIEFVKRIENNRITEEFDKLISIYDLLKTQITDEKIHFSLKNLCGTGHYSGNNYKIYISIKQSDEVFDIVDGGRIDDLCGKFNSNPIPGVCMGIGSTVLAQLIEVENRMEVCIIVNEKFYSNELFQNVDSIIDVLNDRYSTSVYLYNFKKKRKIFLKDPDGKKVYILIDNNDVEVRCKDYLIRKDIINILEKKSDGKYCFKL